MQITPLYQLTLTDEEMDALYDICQSALDAELLDGMAKAMACAFTSIGEDDDGQEQEQLQGMMQ